MTAKIMPKGSGFTAFSIKGRKGVFQVLIVREFDITLGVANSDGKPVASLGTKSYVALYDNKVVSDVVLRKFCDEFKGFGESQENANIVVLPVNVWKRLRGMIVNNYTMVEKK